MHELLEKHKKEREDELLMHAETIKNTMVISSASAPIQNTLLQDQITELRNQVLFLQNEINVLKRHPVIDPVQNIIITIDDVQPGQTDDAIQNINIDESPIATDIVPID